MEASRTPDLNRLRGRLRLLEGDDVYRLARAHGVISAHDGAVPDRWAEQGIRVELGRAAAGMCVRALAAHGVHDRLLPVSELFLCDAGELPMPAFEDSDLHRTLSGLVVAAHTPLPARGPARARLLGSSIFFLADSSFVQERVRADYELAVSAALRGSDQAHGRLVEMRPSTGELAFFATSTFVSFLFGAGVSDAGQREFASSALATVA